jgi:transcription-repair coupling factor (superfamily II helicase)
MNKGSVDAVEQLRGKWIDQLGQLPEMYSGLLSRSICRIACRRLGITELKCI